MSKKEMTRVPIRIAPKKAKKSKRKKKSHSTKPNFHPLFQQKLSIGERASDLIADYGGSWGFILVFSLFLLSWIAINAFLFLNKGFDPYPFILLNLVLSTLAAFQAPIILMAQNRQASRDRIDAKYDHAVNRKAEREVQALAKDLASVRRMVRRLHDKK
jgi:uncharacterized membrane protein